MKRVEGTKSEGKGVRRKEGRKEAVLCRGDVKVRGSVGIGKGGGDGREWRRKNIGGKDDNQ